MLTATTTNQFVAQAALREAERIVKESQRIRMSARMDFLFCRGAWSERGARIQSRIVRASRRPWHCATPPATCAPAAACCCVWIYRLQPAPGSLTAG
ncbi:type II toxin-antitoxin system TacA family antitoxin [Xanthomonas graminis]